jgi:hypothetical protein
MRPSAMRPSAMRPQPETAEIRQQNRDPSAKIYGTTKFEIGDQFRFDQNLQMI